MSIKVKLEDEIKRKIPEKEEPSFNDEIIMGLDYRSDLDLVFRDHETNESAERGEGLLSPGKTIQFRHR